jgi:hypothetical protein
VLGRHLADVDGGVVAHIEDGEIGRRAVGIVGHGLVPQRNHLGFLGTVDRERRRRAVGGADRVGHLLDLGRGAAGHQHMVALFRKAAARGGAQALFRTDSEHDRLLFPCHIDLRSDNAARNLRCGRWLRYGPPA